MNRVSFSIITVASASASAIKQASRSYSAVGGLFGLCLGLRLGLTVFAAPTPASVACSAASRWNRDLGCSFSSSFSGVLFFLIFALPSPKRSWASHGPPPLLRFPLLRRNP